jgi:hypothetical protein
MADPVETRRKLERLMRRVERRDVYGRLLNHGMVHERVVDIDDPDRWRDEIKRQARKDKIKVRTGITSGFIWAEMVETGKTGSDDLIRMNRVFQAVLPIAVEHRHEPKSLVSDQEEFALGCERCQAIGYVDGTSEPPLAAGPLFEEDCPNEEPPRATGLTEVWGGREALERIWAEEGKPPE